MLVDVRPAIAAGVPADIRVLTRTVDWPAHAEFVWDGARRVLRRGSHMPATEVPTLLSCPGLLPGYPRLFGPIGVLAESPVSSAVRARAGLRRDSNPLPPRQSGLRPSFPALPRRTSLYALRPAPRCGSQARPIGRPYRAFSAADRRGAARPVLRYPYPPRIARAPRMLSVVPRAVLLVRSPYLSGSGRRENLRPSGLPAAPYSRRHLPGPNRLSAVGSYMARGAPSRLRTGSREDGVCAVGVSAS